MVNKRVRGLLREQGRTMTKYLLAAAATLAFSGTALAEEATTVKEWSVTSTPVTAPTVMTDAEMNQVTAAGKPEHPGYGQFPTAYEAIGSYVGHGRCTAGKGCPSVP